MKLVKRILIIFVATYTFQSVIAQDFQPPKNISLDNASDYAKYEKDIISCVEWLEVTPVSQQPEKRKEANAFLVMWITGSPNITISLHAEIIGMLSDNGDLLTAFMGGWTKFALQNPDLAGDEIKCNAAGLISAIKVYKANKNAGIKRDKELDKVVKIEENGKLENWIADRLKK